MKLIVGLGNPGQKYSDTRHNVGFMIIDYLSGLLNIPVRNIKYQSIIGQGMLNSQKVILAKPQTYMNLSGHAVLDIYNYYKLTSMDIMVAHDDMDLEWGTIRIRPGGGPGGHRGIESIIYSLESDEFPRLRFGIGKPKEKDERVDFVLEPFGSKEREGLPSLIQHSAKGINEWIVNDIYSAMNKFNSKV